ncbi:EutP/PduV family microcompartment system protein [Halobacillus sp. BBL2006]|uniref:EutP/PduV family microcompartment system protein n=1 Tax=Halobacillus sp. BBL2006 TaxID=1543706 RepID=UPI000542593F|nr:EutP/PduV family microcompartment system protein [Halobacillus sp. BBL2006]KHE71947.1 ethanolamine utilization protein EutP [Halobacillus sp. BBL2006]
MSKRNRAMMIGSIGAGKSTLTQALLGHEAKAVKTQTLNYEDWIVDTPGEYTENPMFYKNIMATSFEVTHVLFIQDAAKKKVIFPPGFSTGLNKLPIGVVTKSDDEQADLSRAVKQLKKVIPKGPIIMTSAIEGKGLDLIRELVACNSLQEMREYVEKAENEAVIFNETLYK